jgi:hypothetical protein
MVNHDKLGSCTGVKCFKCHAKLEESAFRPFSYDTTLDGLAEEDRKIILNPKRKYSYYYCPCCLQNLVIINGSGYYYGSGRWERIASFEFNPSRRDDIQKKKEKQVKGLEEYPSRESGHL